MTVTRTKADLDAADFTLADGSLTAAKFPAALDVVNLPAIRKRLRNLPDLLDYGSTSDMSAAMNAAQTAAASEGWRKILVPAGTWQQATTPNALTYGMLYEGEDRSTTVVNVTHTGSAFYFTGQNGGGGGVRNMFIQLGGATSAFSAVRADGSASGWAPDGLDVDNLWITYQSSGRWTYGAYLDGAPRGQAIVSGTLAVSPPSNVVTISGASYGTNQFAGGLLQIRMTSGTAAGQARTITSNTSNTITMASSFSPNATAGDSMVVETVLYGLRNIRISKLTTFGTTSYAIYARNVRAADFNNCLLNGVGGVSTIALVGNSSGSSEINNGVSFSGMTFGQLLINNTYGLNGSCLPQSGFNSGGGVTSSSLGVPIEFWNLGPSIVPITGLTLFNYKV